MAGFRRTYRCNHLSEIQKPNPENGDKILMPASALDELLYLPIEYPMLFELQNPKTGKVSHCGVLEFTAEEGLIFMPQWMMDNMRLSEGDLIIIQDATLCKGTFVKLQPHAMAFTELSNPKAVLETTLRNYSCLTTGDTIMVMHNNNKFYFDVLETKPFSAVSIIETDCEVDFAVPLDYKEPEKEKIVATKQKTEDEEVNKFVPFKGNGRRLDGKSSTKWVNSLDNSGLKQKKASCSSDTPNDASSSRKLVFGSNTVKPKVREEKSIKEEQPSFKAFSGKSYRLMD